VARDIGLACVIYAAKSTEDRRGSIPDQLRECREAIEREGNRLVVGEYADEAFSAFHGSRGPGLADAMQHAEELARESGTAELWALHSDRLARGDGRVARHAVEVALWALKRDVRVRTIQDPDTFRDLLYAVVTGQRNHEDSRRKGLASAAGYRRALERGEYTGTKADGYRRMVEIDDDGNVNKRLEIDPERQPVIDLLFRLALRGKASGAIARALNDAGWRTKPREKGQQPQPWNASGVLVVLHNPRYASLAATKGEIVGPAQWSPYITERQHHRLQVLIADRRRRGRPRETEAFLLSRIATCDRCGEPLHCHTGLRREDGTFTRRYTCRSHCRGRHAARCEARPIDADVLEWMFISMLRHMLHDPPEQSGLLDTIQPLEGHWAEAPEREQIREAALVADDARMDRSIERLVARMVPGLAMQRRAAASRQQASQLELERRFDAWAETHGRPVTDEMRVETRELNRVLHTWFSDIRIENAVTDTVIAAQRRPVLAGGRAPPPVEVRLDRREWIRAVKSGGRTLRRPAEWADEEILAALQEWAARHGRSPNSCEWIAGSPDRPGSLTVRRRFKTWDRALKRAGLEPDARRQFRYWTDSEILDALRAWGRRNGRAPTAKDWIRATPRHPCTRSVAQRYGTFGGAVLAAGLAPGRGRLRRVPPGPAGPREEIRCGAQAQRSGQWRASLT
jgi:DNA invertase Pin-like site-specific DNA recombinase